MGGGVEVLAGAVAAALAPAADRAAGAAVVLVGLEIGAVHGAALLARSARGLRAAGGDAVRRLADLAGGALVVHRAVAARVVGEARGARAVSARLAAALAD